MGVRLTHRRPVRDGGDALLHMAAWLPIGPSDGARLETLVPRAGAESAQGVLHTALVDETLGRGWRCACMDTIVVSQ